MLHKDYDCKGAVAKETSDPELQGSWRHDDLIGGKLPVVN
jgi:hypothetical protein